MSRSTRRRWEAALAVLFAVVTTVVGGGALYFVSTMAVHSDPAAVPSTPGLQAERHFLLGGDVADVLLFLGDRVEDAAAEVAEDRDGRHDEGGEEPAARHGASLKGRSILAMVSLFDGDTPHALAVIAREHSDRSNPMGANPH